MRADDDELQERLDYISKTFSFSKRVEFFIEGFLIFNLILAVLRAIFPV